MYNFGKFEFMINYELFKQLINQIKIYI